MSFPFTNVHTHVFNSSCAPDRFLRIIPVKGVRRFPGLIKSVLDSRPGRGIIRLLASLDKRSNKRREVNKYIAFLDIGTEASQLEVFQRAYEAGRLHDPAVRIVGLTMNMDYMDSQPSKNQISFVTQLEDVKNIKRYYPASFFPFLGIDPRHMGGIDLVNWARPYFENGVVHKPTGKVYPFFCGIKLYPALGFFPFDPRLDELYKYAERNKLPIMTHCTRAGSQYIGNDIEGLIPDEPLMLAPPDDNPAAFDKIRESISKRINDYKKAKWIQNSKLGENDKACDLFGHPDNYLPLLIRYPQLKICMAHMGGSNEVIQSLSGDLAEIRKVDTIDWFTLIRNMMFIYPNLYTDISYTLSDFDDATEKGDKKTVTTEVSKFLTAVDQEGKPFLNRVLFGTDFFMTEQEKREAELYANTKKCLKDNFDIIGRINPQQFLMQPL